MGINNFKPFAAAANANVMTQADYEALAALITGFQSGTAQSAQLNKVWRQSSIISAVLAQFIVDLTGQDAIDDGSTATLLANLKTAVQAQSAAIVGQTRNLAMAVTAASSTATLTADEIVVATALGGQKYVLKQFSKTVNLATTGVGGMDAGTAPTSRFVALYAIYNPTTGASALLATNAATKQNNVYGGANMPAGYTASALVSVWPTNSSGQFIAANQQGRSICIPSVTVLSTSATQPTPLALSVASAVPVNARAISGVLGVAAGSSARTMALQLYTSPLTTQIGFQDCAGSFAANTGIFVSLRNLPMPVPQTVYYVTSNTAGTPNFSMVVSGYDF
jgi:hypothetical protein